MINRFSHIAHHEMRCQVPNRQAEQNFPFPTGGWNAERKHNMRKKGPQSTVSASWAFFTHLSCGLALAAGFWVARNVYSINLVSHPDHTLLLIWVIQCPFVILLYSCFRKNPEKCLYLKAVARGLLGLPLGAFLNALGALALGAPVGIQFLKRTINWPLMMSLFTVVPATSVYGSSWADWHRIFAQTKPNGALDYMVCLPAHGALIGAWFGAWPMPLDWERPWQEWPICVTYGAIVGYVVGMVASFALVLAQGKQKYRKAE